MSKSTLNLNGVIASEGLAIGRIFVYNSIECQIIKKNIHKNQIKEEILKFDKAISLSKKQLNQEIQNSKSNPELFSIFKAQLLLLDDPILISNTKEKIENQLCNVESALQTEMLQIINFLEESGSNLVRERVADVEDVCQRILIFLKSQNKNENDKFNKLINENQKVNLNSASFKSPIIIAAYKMLPSIFLKMQFDKIEGLVCEKGGVSGHLAILARSNNIPLLIKIENLLQNVKNEQLVLLDCFSGKLIIDPKEKDILSFQNYISNRAKNFNISFINEKILTKDQKQVSVSLNLDDQNSIPEKNIKKVNGVGLFRTEFLYFREPDLFSFKKKHFNLYKNIFKKLQGVDVNIRLIDISPDKPLPREISVYSRNQIGVRFLLENISLLKSQLEAIFTALYFENYPDKKCKILIPMVTKLEEVLEIKKIIQVVIKKIELKYKEKIPKISIGVMLETPACIEIMNFLNEHIDFYNVGTNDLSRLNIAADRSDFTNNDDFLYHPALYHQCKKIISNVLNSKNKISICVCGSIVEEKKIIPLLLGLGFYHFSIPLNSLSLVINTSREVFLEDCKKLANNILTLSTISEIKNSLENFFYCKNLS